MNKAFPKYRFVNVQRNSFSEDKENKNAAGTAHETVGQPGILTQIIANIINKQPIDAYIRAFAGLDRTAYLRTTSSTVSSASNSCFMIYQIKGKPIHRQGCS